MAQFLTVDVIPDCINGDVSNNNGSSDIGAGDVIFDWTAVDVPVGSGMIQSFSETPPNIIIDVLDGLIEPTTIIYPKGKNLCKHILSEDKSIGFRIPNNKFCLELISLMNKPLVSTSANIHKEAFPNSFTEINYHILKQVDYVVNLPRYNWSTKPSSVIKIDKFGNFFKIR